MTGYDTARAILFDMDGVLVDSEPVIEAAAIAGLAEFGVNAKPEDFIPFIGAGEDKYVGGVAEKHGVPYRKEMKNRVYQIYVDIVQSKLCTYEGVNELLIMLKDKGWHMSLASSADRVKIDANIKAAGLPRDCFSAIISGEDVVEKKPSPEIYLKAAAMLGIHPSDCVVVEDAINGIKAARAAGMRCIGITTSFTAEELKKEGADFVCSRIRDIYDIL